jgi:hypothetical protein
MFGWSLLYCERVQGLCVFWDLATCCWLIFGI